MRGLGFALAGLVLGGAAAVAVAVLVAMVADIPQAEGAYAMGWRSSGCRWARCWG